ncbi:hypothetical protein Vretimale_13527 [Volvox reticuliferus]|uniref:SGNH hydrolase-type esterase domain-containing protein n=1 Tax=Volvox reticuliferus TaxID=1737510 RepID=A0A8J4LTM8_9CHLO|nr:hypothetical protein Vretifemale_348 [Volvox reticuliferus]GIM09725.1 hypothetical protein Vretimale_13527 [Volvox reticuliferus]
MMLNFPRSWVTQLLLVSVALQPLIDPRVNAFVLGPDFIGIGAPWFPLEPRGAACYDYFFSLAEADCTTHNSVTLPVRLHNCVVDGASGVLVLERATDPDLRGGDEGGTAIYRLRIAGPDGLWLLEPTYCRPDFALVKYDLRQPGLFSIEVLMLYSSFSFIQPNASRALQAPWVGYLTFDVQLVPSSTPSSESGASQEPDNVYLASQNWTSFPDESILLHDGLAGGGAYRSRHQHPDGKASVPLCPDTGPLPGRWYFANWPPTAAVTVTAAAALLRTCVWYTSHDNDADCNSPQHRPLHFDSHPAALSWKPYGCRMRTFAGIPLPPLRVHHDGSTEFLPPSAPVEPLLTPPITPGMCLPPGRRVCFIGDSHTRYLLNSLVLWQRDFQATVDNAAKELLTSDNVHYEYMRWGDDWLPQDDAGGSTVDTLAAANCTDILANFGQWPASYRAGPSPYSALQYLRQLLRLRRVLLAARRARGVRVFWITTCMSTLKARLEAAGTDWRTDPLLTLYNRLALDVMSGELPAVLARARAPQHQDVGDVGYEEHLHQLEQRSGTAGRAALQTGFGSQGPASMRVGGDGKARGKLGPQTGSGTKEREGKRGFMSSGQKDRLQMPSRLPKRSRRGAAEKGEAQARGSESAEQRWQRRPEGQLQPQAEIQAQAQQRDAFLHREGRSNAAATTAITSTTANATATTTLSSPPMFLSKLLGRNVPLKGRRRLLLLLEGEAEAEAADLAAGTATGSVAPQRETIPVIDTWSATRILHDTTWDGVHYTNLGAVGLVQLTAVLHALCSETVLSELNAGLGFGTGQGDH